MFVQRWIFSLFLTAAFLIAPLALGCERTGERNGDATDEPAEAGSDGDEARIDENLGSLKVMNSVNEPVSIYLDGEELFAVPAGQTYTFRNLPTRQVSIFGVGEISQKHYGLPEITIQEGGEYEWTIRP